MSRIRVFMPGVLACVVGAIVVSSAYAEWKVKKMNGTQVFVEPVTGLEWTRTLGSTPSNLRGKEALQRVQQLGPKWRLPTFEELQTMYNEHNGGQVLNIHDNDPLRDYYETDDPDILGNAFGNGFQNPQQRVGIGRNWYLGVRDP